MNQPYYLLISREESIELTKNFRISIPSFPRVVEDLGEIKKLSVNIEEKLIELNINDEKDFLVILVSGKRNSESITVTIPDVLNLYCLNESALNLFRSTVNPNFKYTLLSDLGIDINVSELINKVRTRKLNELLKDDGLFAFEREKLAQFEKGDYSSLTRFKRECQLKPTDFLFFNDVVVIAALHNSNDDRLYNSYMAQGDIAQKSSIYKKYEENNLKDKSIEDIVKRFVNDVDDMEKLNSLLKGAFGFDSELGGFSFVIFCLIYLKIIDLYQEENCGLVDVHEIYKQLSKIDGIEYEIQSACYLFLNTCGFENLYTEYYKFKQFNVNTGSEVVSYSVLQESHRKQADEIQRLIARKTEIELENEDLRKDADHINQEWSCKARNLEVQNSELTNQVKDKDRQLESLNAILNKKCALENTLKEENRTLNEKIEKLSSELTRVSAPAGTVAEETDLEVTSPSITFTLEQITNLKLSKANKNKLLQQVEMSKPELVESLKRSFGD